MLTARQTPLTKTSSTCSTFLLNTTLMSWLKSLCVLWEIV